MTLCHEGKTRKIDMLHICEGKLQGIVGNRPEEALVCDFLHWKFQDRRCLEALGMEMKKLGGHSQKQRHKFPMLKNQDSF